MLDAWPAVVGCSCRVCGALIVVAAHLLLLPGCTVGGVADAGASRDAAASLDGPATPYTFQDIIKAARDAAAGGQTGGPPISLHRASAPLPDVLTAMDYDGFTAIGFDPAHAVSLGGSGAYSLQGFHRGWLYADPVHIEVVSGGVARPWAYNPAAFQFGDKAPRPDPAWGDLGWAGLKINRPWRRGEGANELFVLLGATYFRALGEGSAYGASGRLIAVNTGIPGVAESFPRVTSLWVHTPLDERGPLTVDGYLDGEHLTGAFRMVIHPGATTAIDVDLHLFTRQPIQKLGLAPITSMFLFGPEPDPRFRDARPEVHDSDGLLVHTESQVYYQPLRNPHADRTTRLSDPALTGFGLVQRERRFERYLDWNTRHELRPDVWVTPRGDWPDGAVEVLELARLEEKIDNIGCYYAIDDVPAGQSIHAAYTVSFGSPVAALHASIGQPAETARLRSADHADLVLGGEPALDYKHLARAQRVVFARTPWPRWEIIFDGPALRERGPDAFFPCVVADRNGNKVYPAVHRLPDGSWRVDLAEDLAYPVDVRFEDFSVPLSETVRLQEPNP